MEVVARHVPRDHRHAQPRTGLFRHDRAAMLHAPLRTVIYADTEGDTRFAVDQPSTLFASYDNPAIVEVGRELDRLVANLLTNLGAQVPEELAS
jgi:uncharacterized protein (DUF302 family)